MDMTVRDRKAFSSRDFFNRVRARLSLEVPAALTDHTAEARRGDLDLDPLLWERAGVQATRPAAVLVRAAEPREKLRRRFRNRPQRPPDRSHHGTLLMNGAARTAAAANGRTQWQRHERRVKH